jgi:pyridoxine/pyridoxamine 5'-phosphate oxidase
VKYDTPLTFGDLAQANPMSTFEKWLKLAKIVKTDANVIKRVKCQNEEKNTKRSNLLKTHQN